MGGRLTPACAAPAPNPQASTTACTAHLFTPRRLGRGHRTQFQPDFGLATNSLALQCLLGSRLHLSRGDRQGHRVRLLRRRSGAQWCGVGACATKWRARQLHTPFFSARIPLLRTRGATAGTTRGAQSAASEPTARGSPLSRMRNEMSYSAVSRNELVLRSSTHSLVGSARANWTGACGVRRIVRRQA